MCAVHRENITENVKLQAYYYFRVAVTAGAMHQSMAVAWEDGLL